MLHSQLVEVVMDLGRPPFARFASSRGDVQLVEECVTAQQLQQAVQQVRGVRVMSGGKRQGVMSGCRSGCTCW